MENGSIDGGICLFLKETLSPNRALDIINATGLVLTAGVAMYDIHRVWRAKYGEEILYSGSMYSRAELYGGCQQQGGYDYCGVY